MSSQNGPYGDANYNSMNLIAQKRVSRGWGITASWTWSKSLDDGSLTQSGNTSLAEGPVESIEYGRSSFDVRNRFVASYVFELPFGRGRRFGSYFNGIPGKVLEGWELNGITSYQSGQPVEVVMAKDQCGTGFSNACRPNVITNPNLPPDQRTPTKWFNTAAFVYQTLNTLGDEGRNIIDGPGIKDYDLSLAKNTKISDRQVVRFQADFFNAFNHPNFGFPGRLFDAPGSFGRISSASAPRLIQFSLKYSF
jgi:hypothetical protein